MKYEAGYFNKLYEKMQEQLSESRNTEPKPKLNVKCTSCTTLVRVEHFSDLKPGDHICMGGQHSMFNVGKHQVSFYKHHAIIKYIKHRDNSSAILTMVHFTATPNDCKIKIQETREMKDLHYQEIYLIRYRHGTLPVDVILKRAESFLDDKETKYSLFQCNCEHFCQWCCIGMEESFQVQKLKKAIGKYFEKIGYVACKILRVVTIVALSSADDISAAAYNALNCGPYGVLIGVAVLYLIYCIFRQVELQKRLHDGTMCKSCYNQQKMELWSRFLVYCLSRAGGLALVYLIIGGGFCSGGVACGALALVIIPSLMLMWGIPKFVEELKSPFAGKKITVDTLNDIGIGDVISTKGIHAHDCVVTAVTVYTDTADGQRGEVNIIHYSQHWFSTREIKEEVMKIDLNKHKILRHDYTGYNVHSPEVVLQRAQKRIGERKHRLLSNRSAHFCHWAKVDEGFSEVELENIPTLLINGHCELYPYENISEYKQVLVDHRRAQNHATKIVSEETAKIREDIKAGQLIRFKKHTAVTTKVDYRNQDESVITITVVHYGKEKEVREDKCMFNLHHDDVTIIRHHPIYRYNKEDIIQRARAKVGESKYSYFNRRSSHLAYEIVERKKDKRAIYISDIKQGDVLTYYYRSRKHDAVVTDVVSAKKSITSSTGHITIVHYAQGYSFSIWNRTVEEDTIYVDLSTDDVYVKGYDGFYTYKTETVVKRARTRIGEQRHSVFGNTSSDLAHWAKVIQEPSVVSEDDGEKRLVVPRIADKMYGKFQKTPVYAWSTLSPGTLVELSYYPGILTEANETTKSIKVIHYDHVSARRTIIESTIRIDLKKNDLWIYRVDQRECNEPTMVVNLAKKMVGEQKLGLKKRSWDFCISCKLKNIENNNS